MNPSEQMMRAEYKLQEFLAGQRRQRLPVRVDHLVVLADPSWGGIPTQINGVKLRVGLAHESNVIGGMTPRGGPIHFPYDSLGDVDLGVRLLQPHFGARARSKRSVTDVGLRRRWFPTTHAHLLIVSPPLHV